MTNTTEQSGLDAIATTVQAIATTVQSSFNFGGVPFGSSGPDITPISDLPSFNGGVEIQDAPADATLSVSMSGDTDHFL